MVIVVMGVFVIIYVGVCNWVGVILNIFNVMVLCVKNCIYVVGVRVVWEWVGYC